WGVDVGDELYWEVEMILTNASNGQVTMMFKDIWIYNITSIENVTTDWLGVNEFSQVNATQNYFNVTGDISEQELESYDDPMEFALFGFNNSDSIKHKYRAGMGVAPFILPLNGSKSLEVDVLIDILNESFYGPLSPDRFNQFDGFTYAQTTNSMFFTNSSDGYYLNLMYNATNGVAEYAEGYMMVQMGEPMLLNFTIQRVLDYDITDEIEWGVNIGDIFYYDWTNGTNSYYDVKIEVIDFADVMLNKTHNGFMEGEIHMVFQAVYGNLSVWNGTTY
ncbi:unnamed protein product, partial [marine sediment metagenome]